MKATWRYYFDFFWAPLTLILVTVLTARSPSWFALCALGLVLFGFVEYAVHRWLLHGPLWKSSNHDHHHDHPSDLIFFPVYLTPAIFAGFFMVLPYAIFAGFTAGFVWFTYWHFVLHQCNLANHRLVQRYAQWHLIHHAGEKANFGITSPLFDVIFRTYRAAK